MTMRVIKFSGTAIADVEPIRRIVEAAAAGAAGPMDLVGRTSAEVRALVAEAVTRVYARFYADHEEAAS